MDFCYELVNCSIDPQNQDKCPRILSDLGDACRTWAQHNKLEADNLARQYCLTHNGPECLCINREQEEEYDKLRPDKKSSPLDACWWKPCSQPEKYLVTSELEQPNCGRRLCRDVNRKFKKAKLENRQNLTCDAQEPSTFWSKYGPWIIGGAIFIIIIALIICIFILIRRSKAKKSMLAALTLESVVAT